MQFLLKQADVFKHFMPAAAARGAAAKARGRHGGTSEAAEDDALLADEDAAADVGHRLTVQPGVIKHGTMRE